MIKYVKCLLKYQFINYTYNRHYFSLSLPSIRGKAEWVESRVSKYLLKNQEHTSQTSKGLMSPVFKLHLLSVCSPKGICSVAPPKNPGSKAPSFSTRRVLNPWEVFGNKGIKVPFLKIIISILWCYWHLLPGEQDAKCPAMHLHTKKSLDEKQWTLAHYKSNLRWRISCNTWPWSSEGKGNQNWPAPIPRAQHYKATQ